MTGGDSGHRSCEMSEGTRRESGEDVELGEPARAAGAFDDELARLAVEGLEMALVAFRHPNPGRDGDVEAGFVMKQNDVRELAGWMACRGHADFKAFSYGLIRFEIAVRDALID